MKIIEYTSDRNEELFELMTLNTPDYFATEELDDFIYYLDNFADNYYLVEDENRIVACGGFNLTDDHKTARISWDIVHPDFHGSGYGSALIKHRVEQILQIPTVEIILVRTSQLVYRFYEKFGLELREVVKDFWAKGFDMYRLDCKISEVRID